MSDKQVPRQYTQEFKLEAAGFETYRSVSMILNTTTFLRETSKDFPSPSSRVFIAW